MRKRVALVGKVPKKGKELTLFREIMGKSPTIKIIEFLLEWKGFDLTLTDIARGAKVGRANTYEIIGMFEKKGILKQTRVIGRSRFYTLNKESKVTKQFISLFTEIIKKGGGGE